MSPRAWRNGLILGAAVWGLIFGLVFGCSSASAHVPTVANTAGTVRGWTHADHRDDSIGVTAFLQNQHGVVRGIGHDNTIYRTRGPWPQVGIGPKPARWDGGGEFITTAPAGFEWWWTRARMPDGSEGVCIYDRRPVMGITPSFPRNYACLGPNETTLVGPLDGDVRFPGLGQRTVTDVPPDFIRRETAPQAAPVVQRPVSDAPAFLARYGLDASAMPPIVLVDRVEDAAGYGDFDVDAAAYPDRIELEPHKGLVDPRYMAADAMHEALHYASFYRWHLRAQTLLDLDRAQAEAWLMRYEEGLVQAVTDALLPNWWRYLTGRRLERGWRRVSFYEPQVRWWKALAQRATGASWRSRAGRDWLIGALALGPVERVALATTTHEGPAATTSPGATTTPL